MSAGVPSLFVLVGRRSWNLVGFPEERPLYACVADIATREEALVAAEELRGVYGEDADVECVLYTCGLDPDGSRFAESTLEVMWQNE